MAHGQLSQKKIKHIKTWRRGRIKTPPFLFSVNIIMKYNREVYHEPLRQVIKETSVETGYVLPVQIEMYVIELLVYYIDRPNFLPEQTFTESLYKLDHRSSFSAKDLGDTCLFVTGVFPNYGKKYGLNKSYYKNIGKTSYDQASRILNHELFSALCTHFEVIGKFINKATNPRQTPLIG